jgi:hypothetical protein
VGRALSSLIGRWCLRSPWGALGKPGGAAQDRSIEFGRAPGIGHMPYTGPIWLAVRAFPRLQQGDIRLREPRRPLLRLGFLQGKAAGPAIGRMAAPRCPIDLGGPRVPDGPRGVWVVPSGNFAPKPSAIAGRSEGPQGPDGPRIPKASRTPKRVTGAFCRDQRTGGNPLSDSPRSP